MKEKHHQDSLKAINFNDVAAFLPHSGKMVLLDKIIAFKEHRLIAETIVRNDGLFGDEDKTPSWVGIEYMAQAIAAYIGIHALLAGEPIKLGYLLGTRRYHSNMPAFPAASVLTVTIEKIIQDDKMGVFECRITGDGIEVNANLNVYQPPTDVILKNHVE